MKRPLSSAERKAFLALPCVGPATVGDLELLGIHRLEDLRKRKPEELYLRLSLLTGSRQDPCVLDVFSMLVAAARGEPLRPWFEFSRERLARGGTVPVLTEVRAKRPRAARRKAAPKAGRARVSRPRK